MSTVADGGKVNGLVIVGVVVGVVIFCVIVGIIGLAAIGVFCWCRISSKKPPDRPATIFLSQQSQNSILSQAQTPLSPSAPAPPPRPLDTHASHQNCEEFTFSLQIFSWMTTALLVIIMVFVVAPLRSRVKLAVNQESLIDEDSVEDLTKI